MTAFFLAAAALVALALAFVLPTLWPQARRSALAMLLVLPLGAAGLYALVGTPDALDPANRRAPESLDEAAAQLERRLTREPESLEGWVLLGRTRKAQGREAATAGDSAAALARFGAAAEAFRTARTLLTNEPDLLVEAAEALSLAHPERRFEAEAVGLLDAALAAQPAHQRALWFRGIAALQAGDGAGAVARWETLLPNVDAATAASLRQQIAEAREAAGLPPSGAADATERPAQIASEATAAAGALSITVEASPEALAALPPGAVLFVFARNADAAGPPVAAKRIEGAQLPLTITLSDADAMMPTATLSSTARVEVSARYAASGAVQAPQAGDLVATPVVVETAKAAPLRLVLQPADAPARP